MREKVKLDSLCNPSKGLVSLKEDALIDYFDISSVDNEYKKVVGYETYMFSAAPSRARKAVEEGNIIISTVRPNLNAVAMFDTSTENIPVVSTGFCVLDCKDGVDSQFVFFFCKSKTFIEDMVSKATGASYPAVSDKIIREALIPLYSHDEQKIIVSKLKKIADVIELRKQELQELDNLIKSRFVELFGNPVLNPMNWPVKKLGDITTKIGSGATPRGGKESYREDGILLIRSMNVHNGRFEYKELAHISDEQAERLDNVTLELDDVLLNITGASVARCCIVPEDVLPARVNQHVCIVRCKDYVCPEFLNHLLIEDNYQKLLWKIAGSGATREAITKQQVEELSIIIPPKTVQQEFSHFVKQVTKLKFEVQKSLDETQTLMDSLMQQYFG